MRYTLLLGLCLAALSVKAQNTDEDANTHLGLLEAVSPSKTAMAKNMLDRVEKIRLIDTLHVDASDFFTYYNLSVDAGELLDGTSLPVSLSSINPRVVYRTQNGKEMLWAEPVDSVLTVMSSLVLDDGTVMKPVRLSEALNDGGGDADYPFVMQDGTTVYFANNGENSLGGYDIFMTRRSPDGEVLQPQNIGMPFNSPYDDYMMVIDESRNLGWWASDRERIPGIVTIYVFEPSQMRVNYDPDTENIEDLAMLENVKPEGGLKSRLADQVTVNDDQVIEFYLEIGNKVYTNMSQIRHSSARQAMQQLIEYMEDCEHEQARLNELRERYAKGDKSVAGEIMQIESAQRMHPAELKRLRNKVVSLDPVK